ncbi:MAG: sulfatase [Proteobacteria bacterium]|nr:sulfatase [Pseudomonadota bacterium]
MTKKNDINTVWDSQILGAGLLLSLVIVSCANGSNGPDPMGADEKKVSELEIERALERNRTMDAPAAQRSSNKDSNYRKIYDFGENLSAAHLRSGGLLIDFGTPARHKYTLGDWKTGFYGDYSRNGTTFSYMSSSVAHIFFDVFSSESQGGKIVFRVRGHGSEQAGIYLNGKYIGTIELPPGEFGYASVDASGKVIVGQNDLMIRCKRRSRVPDGPSAALALDYVRIMPENAKGGPAAASYDAVRFPDPAGGSDNIVLAPGESLTFNLPIPKNARLLGSAHTRVGGEIGHLAVVAIHGNQTEKLLGESDVGENAWRINMDLNDLSGRMIGMTLRASRGEVILRDVGLFLSHPDGKKAPGKFKARNFVLIVIDTLRADKLALYNDRTRVRTDYLNTLGAEAMVFDKALAPENWTKPSVVSILSGIYPTTHKTQDDRSKLPSSVVIAPEHFKKLGFATAGFVANGYVSRKFGFKRGWDTWTNYVRESKRNRAKYVVDDTIDWLESRPADKPFFLYVHTIDPHVPYIPPQKYWMLYDKGPYTGPVQAAQTAKLLEAVKSGKQTLTDRDKFRLEALYDGEITYHDDHLARLHDALQRMGLLEDTLIVVTSDHGEEFFEHGKVGHGHSLY